jgi:hypothetical protein
MLPQAENTPRRHIPQIQDMQSDRIRQGKNAVKRHTPQTQDMQSKHGEIKSIQAEIQVRGIQQGAVQQIRTRSQREATRVAISAMMPAIPKTTAPINAPIVPRMIAVQK